MGDPTVDIITVVDGFEFPVDDIDGNNLLLIEQPDTLAGLRKQKKILFSSLKTWLQDFTAGFSLLVDKPVMRRITSESLTSGWYSVLTTEQNDRESSFANLAITAYGSGSNGTTFIRVGHSQSIQTNSRINNTVEIVSESYEGSPVIKNVRLLKSDTDSAAGAILQIEVDAAIDVVLQIQLLDNLGSIDKGWVLQQPSSLNLDHLPDESIGTYITAGEFLTLHGSSGANEYSAYSNFTAIRIDDDTLYCHLVFPSRPKLGTTLELVESTGFSLFFTGFDGYTANVNSPWTLTGFVYHADDNSVNFNIVQTNIGASLATLVHRTALISNGDLNIKITD